MGIKFNCHACGKKLNVKTFLAGKRGICPHCGGKVDIPADTVNDRSGVSVAPQSVSPLPNPMPVADTPGSTNGTGATAVPVRPLSPVAETTSPVSLGAASATPISIPSTPAQERSAQPSTPTDPIDESPQSVWYVRPPAGGQFGPAAGEIMRRWIAEGRVSNDSLVWREGWADWQTANVVFPQLGSGNPPPPSTGPVSASSSPSPLAGVSQQSSPVGRVPRRKSSNTLAMVLVVMLTFAALGLIILFLLVVSGAFGNFVEVPQT